MTREEYIEEMQRYYKSPGMIKYLLKEFSSLCEFSDGHYVVFNKPTIKTRFCFGYNDRLPNDSERASRVCDMVSKNEEYFIEENLKELENKINNIKKYPVYIMKALFDQPESIKMCCLCFNDDYGAKKDIIRRLNADERDVLLAACEEEKRKFLKRLKTYLKRYGLSKIHSWTFIED
jgi:hypothetical protein